MSFLRVSGAPSLARHCAMTCGLTVVGGSEMKGSPFREGSVGTKRDMGTIPFRRHQ